MDELAAPAAVVTPRPRPWTVFSSASFRKLWVATTLSLFGDFFNYIALAWLVLQLTGSGLALGSVLVVQALPRAVLMVVGGALADRISSRLTMLGSMGLRTAVVAPLAVLVLTGRVQMWEVYAIAVVFGIVDAFYMPARTSILPKVVADHELEPGNAVLNVTGQASVILGPVLGGLIVTLLGIGWAFAGDAACFAIGFLFVLWLPTAARTAAGEAHADGGLGGQILAGFRYAWADTGIRVLLIVIAVIDFAANGALGVGLPTLAHARFAAGAEGLGILLGGWGVGATAGALGAGFVAPAKTIWMVDRASMRVAWGRHDRGWPCVFAPARRAADGLLGYRHRRRQHLWAELAAAPNRPRHAGPRHVAGHAGVDGPHTAGLRGVWSYRRRQSDTAVPDRGRDDPSLRRRHRVEPDRPLAALALF
jgi:MFS family permease